MDDSPPAKPPPATPRPAKPTRRPVCRRLLSLLALTVLILGLFCVVFETLRSLYVSYGITTHNIRWVEQTGLYTAPAVLSKVIDYSHHNVSHIHLCQTMERHKLRNVHISNGNHTKAVKRIAGEDWYLCPGTQDWRKQSWLRIEVRHGPVQAGLLSTNVGTLLYILPDYNSVLNMSEEDLSEALQWYHMIYVNPHTYVEITLELLRDIDSSGKVTDRLQFFPDRSPGDYNTTQAYISWSSGLFEERQEIEVLSTWSIVISFCGLFLTLDRLNTAASRLSAYPFRNCASVYL